MDKVTLIYETGTCSRCGGSGEYSSCQRFGTRCFKCFGKTTTLTAAGKKASLKVTAFIAEHFSVPVESLVAGDRIKIDGFARTVASVSINSYGVTVELTQPIRGTFGPCSSFGYPQGTLIVKAVAGADWQAVVAFARTIKKGVSIVETPVAEVV